MPLHVSQTALAQCSAGPPVSNNVTCTSAGNPYASGISFSQATPNADLTVTLDTGVNVTLPGSGTGVAVQNSAGGAAILNAGSATINITANPNSSNNVGLSAAATAGNAIINASGPIDVSAAGGGNGIDAFVVGNGDPNAFASVTYIGPSIVSSGEFSTDIQANNVATNGNSSIVASGNMTGFVPAGGQRFSGLFAEAQGNGSASVIYRGGTIDVQGNFANGIFAGADGDGSAEVATLSGTTIFVSGTNPGDSSPTQPVKPGIDAESSGVAADGKSIIMTIGSQIMMFGTTTPNVNMFDNPVAIRALSFVDAPITVTYSGPGIATHGGGGVGILALSGKGPIAVNSSGPITTNGASAIGILADSGKLLNEIQGAPATTGGAITIAGSGAISTQGEEAHGIWAASTTGSVQVTATNVSTKGEYSVAINANGGAGVMVNIAKGGSVMGGWQPDVASIGPKYGLPAAGIALESASGAAILINDGSLGALSDRAVFGDPQIINNGTITGFVQLAGGNNSILNNGVFDLRHFADTSGGGVRDTVRVAVADLGNGPNNSFINNGALALAATTGATTLDRTGQYLPLGNANNAMALGGPLQGQLIGVTTFTNSGTIDLRSNPAPGDVLVITGGRLAGVAGAGTYVSNGGALRLDTALNQGGVATLSDTLVVDGTSVGANGATETLVRNAGGPGALTAGDGILVVQVLDPTRSAPGAFALAGEVRGGPFDYRLFQGGLNGSNPQDWFLRSDFTVGPPEPPPPPEPPIPPRPPPEPLPPGVDPIIGPELATYGVMLPMARQLGMATLGTLHDRIGDTLADPEATPAPPGWPSSAWGRVFGQQVQDHYGAFADPRADGGLFGLQAGLDVWRGALLPDHRDRAGLYVAYSNADVDVNGLVTNQAATGYVLQRTGVVGLNGWSAGAYWTHYGPTGWYLDAVAQATLYTGSASTIYANLDTNGSGLIGSLEGGYPIALPQFGPGFVLEPEAQIVGQQVEFNHANDGLGEVELGSTLGASGRLGLRAKWRIATEDGQAWEPYLRANYWADWGADVTTNFSGLDSVPLLERGQRLELGGGLTTRVSADLSFYANGDYEFAVGDTPGGERNGVRGALGLRYTW